jgi:signal transduction histidine kinase
MESKRSKGLWAIILTALVLVTVTMVLGNRSFNATEKATLNELNERQLVLAREVSVRRLIRSGYRRQQIVVASSILIVLLGASYALAISFRTGKFLEQEVCAKTSELQKSHDQLPTVLDSLEAAHAFQQSILDGVTEPIMVIDKEYRVRLMNRAAREFSSTSADGPQAVLCHQISHRRERPCDGTAHPCPLQQVRESGQPVTVVHEHQRADGERRTVEVIASPFWGEDGAFQGIIESVRDITAREQAVEALQHSTERLRALSARLSEVAETERQHLARELHDRVGQNLTALGINLNLVRTQIPGEGAAAARSRLDDSLQLVEQTAERIRDVMANLRPPVLDDYGLVAALHWYGERFARRTGIVVDVSGEALVPRLAPHVENALFRIVQEALTNVAKHAQATRVTVTVESKGENLRLVVADNGIGFDPTHAVEAGDDLGWGLLTMAERAEAVGGCCSIASVPNRGTQVIVEVAR